MRGSIRCCHEQMGSEGKPSETGQCLEPYQTIGRSGRFPSKKQRSELRWFTVLVITELEFDVVPVKGQQSNRGTDMEQLRGHERTGHGNHIGQRKAREIEHDVFMIETKGRTAFPQPGKE